MWQNIRARWFGVGLAAFAAILAFWGLASLGGDKASAEVSYDLSLTPSQRVQFMTELQSFALQNGYNVIDGSTETREAREYINREEDVGLATGELIDVPLEPKNSGLLLFVFAKTAASDDRKLSLTVVYNKRSSVERSMADDLSELVLKWKRLPITPSS
jgi:hypothetical protein